jgi:hypothetical protein
MAQGEISIGIAGRRRQMEKQEEKIKMMHIRLSCRRQMMFSSRAVVAARRARTLKPDEPF